MRIFAIILFVIIPARVAFAQKTVTLSIHSFEPHNSQITRAQAEKAVLLANEVLNWKGKRI